MQNKKQRKEEAKTLSKAKYRESGGILARQKLARWAFAR
jgi:hypothetical protein